MLELYVKVDMHQLGFWKGLCFHADGFQIHGNSITAANIGALMPVSNLEATDATRLFELWFEQHLFNDKMAVKIGQLAADAEFIISEGGGYFLNGTWGWPSISAADLPSGGPAYPLATPGVRLAVNPNDKLALLVGVYNGDPAPQCANPDPQRCNPYGLDFELDDPPLLMVEGAYTYNPKGLKGTVKLGGWNHFGTFEYQRIDFGRRANCGDRQSRKACSMMTGAFTASSTSWSGAFRGAKRLMASASLPASLARRPIATWSTSISTAA